MRLVEFFTVLNEAGLVSPYAAAKFVASDNELWDAVASYAANVDYYDDLPENTKQRLLSVLKRIKPVKMRLYRGEPSNEFNDFQPYAEHVHRGFTSWSASEDVPRKWFMDTRDHMVKYTDGPVKALPIEHVVYWRNVLTDESIYGGSQAEYFVLEPVERKVEGIREEAMTLDPKTHTGTFVGAKLTPETEDRLMSWMSELGIQNPEPREDIHITVIGDKEKKFPWKAKKYPPLKIDPSNLFIEEFPEGDDGKPLVLRLNSPALQKRHKWGRETHNIDWKFPEYKPHITLGYNTGVTPDEIEPPDFPLFIEGEYVSPWISD